MTFKEALQKAAKECEVLFMPYELAEDMEKTRELFKSIIPGQSVAIFIGPEGGFDEKEVNEAIDAGFCPITLGKRILRTETAGMSVMSVLSYLLEQ